MATTIGVARLTFYFEDHTSLKDKRRVFRSLTKQVRDKFNVSIAEVADLDDMRLGTLVLACVSNSAPHADQMLANVVHFIEARVELGTLGDIETELIHYGD